MSIELFWQVNRKTMPQNNLHDHEPTVVCEIKRDIMDVAGILTVKLLHPESLLTVPVH